MEQYCIYLRKSRSDAEAEARGEGETLARHERALFELARRQKLNVTEVYREVVSGETIAARPVMQKLLQEVGRGIWAGVLVMEVERLARGDTMDQGFVAQAFKYSDTQIITPMKSYDPNNEFDEEYFEFGLFMSRREYKVINRRLQRGRTASIKEGKYVSPVPPYGFDRKKLEREKGFMLVPNPEQAEVVRLIFELYTAGEEQPDGTHKHLGMGMIAKRLNKMKIPAATGGLWSTASLQKILINPTYIGKVRWQYRPSVKKFEDGQVNVVRPIADEDDYIVAEGLHEGIVPPDVFAAVQEKLKQNPPSPVNDYHVVKNPLVGLIICGYCGRRMLRHPSKKGYPELILCPTSECQNAMAQLRVIEERILGALADWLKEYRLKWELDEEPQKTSQIELTRKALKKLEAELAQLEKQRGRAHDLLEQGVYDTDTFLNRTRELGERLQQVQADHAALWSELRKEEAREESRAKIIPKVERLLDVYRELPDAKSKNDLLKEVLEKVVYVREKVGKWKGNPDSFEITLYPKLPSSVDS